jgi:hypothetical protein
VAGSVLFILQGPQQHTSIPVSAAHALPSRGRGDFFFVFYICLGGWLVDGRCLQPCWQTWMGMADVASLKFSCSGATSAAGGAVEGLADAALPITSAAAQGGGRNLHKPTAAQSLEHMACPSGPTLPEVVVCGCRGPGSGRSAQGCSGGQGAVPGEACNLSKLDGQASLGRTPDPLLAEGLVAYRGQVPVWGGVAPSGPMPHCEACQASRGNRQLNPSRQG